MPDAAIRIFISYRRDDTAAYAGRLQDRLIDRFGESNVFIDVTSISAGTDFHRAVTTAISSCQVLLAMIGPSWLEIMRRRDARPQEGDWVHLEIKTSLDRNLRIIPILVESAQLPRADELPPDLEGLTRRQALRLRHTEFRTDTRTIIDEIVRDLEVLDVTAASRAASEPGRINKLKAIDSLFREKTGELPAKWRSAIDVLLGLVDIDEPILNLAFGDVAGWELHWSDIYPSTLLAATTRRFILVRPRTLTTYIIPFVEVLAADSETRWFGTSTKIHLSTPTGVQQITGVTPKERIPELLEIVHNRISR